MKGVVKVQKTNRPNRPVVLTKTRKTQKKKLAKAQPMIGSRRIPEDLNVSVRTVTIKTCVKPTYQQEAPAKSQL